MTVLVAIKCSDGIVVASDSMLTVGGFAQQNGQKIHILPGAQQQIFAFAGSLDLADRFRAEAIHISGNIVTAANKLAHSITLGRNFAQNLQATGLDPLKADLSTVIGFVKDNIPEICLFIFGTQPRFLDAHHPYCAVGSGALAAQPFIKFLTDTLLGGRQPNLAEGKLLATWAVKYAIETLAGNVGEPIDIATIETAPQGGWILRELDVADIEETKQAIAAAKDELKSWKDNLHTNPGADTETDQIPAPPP